MKTINSITYYFVFGFLFIVTLMQTNCFGEDWIPYSTSSQGVIFYIDKGSIISPSTGIVRVWEKALYSASFRGKLIKDLGKDFADQDHINKTFHKYLSSYSHTLTYYQFNCLLRNCITLKTIDFDKEGGQLFSVGKVDIPIEIVPGSVLETLYEQVCPRK